MTPWACTVDWSKFFDVVRDIALSVAALGTAWIAYMGLSRWRDEEIWKANFDLARRMGKAIYGLRDALLFARRPYVMSDEHLDGSAHSGVAGQANSWAHVFNERFKPVREAQIEIQALQNEAETMWGKEVREKLDEMMRKANTLRVAMEAYVANKGSGGEHFAKDQPFGQRINPIVFDGQEMDAHNQLVANPFTAEIDKATAAAAEIVRSKLSFKRT